MSEHLLPSIRWIGPLHDAGEAARGSRALLRLLEAGGYPIQICPLTPHRPVAATDPERVWLGSYTSGATAVDLTVQRAPVRLLRPVTRVSGSPGSEGHTRPRPRRGRPPVACARRRRP